MPTIKFLLQSENEQANIYVRYSIDRKKSLKRRTGYVVSPADWVKINSKKIVKDDRLKALQDNLELLKSFLGNSLNDANRDGINLTGKWLQEQIDIFNNKKPANEFDLITNYIDKFISEAKYKPNQKKEVGLSAGRIANMKLFKTKILEFEREVQDGKRIAIKEITPQFAEKFKLWFFEKGYNVNYVGKHLANLKAICNDAAKFGVETSPRLKYIKVISENILPENIVYLSDAEQQLIKSAFLPREALINARKWLLLGCLIGQRGGDLLNISDKNIKQLGEAKIIELKQRKTGKLVAIPLLPDALEVIENGMPYKISLPRFNEYIKEICKIAGLDAIMVGRSRESNKGATSKGNHPKWQLVSSHVCRRSFATNFYGRIPTPVLMNITAHGTEKIFLAYIGKTTYDNAYSMLEYFAKLQPVTKAPVLEVVRASS